MRRGPAYSSLYKRAVRQTQRDDVRSHYVPTDVRHNQTNSTTDLVLDLQEAVDDKAER